MYALLTVLKVVSVIWMVIVVGNFFRSSYFVIVSRTYQTDDESYIKRAKKLLFLGVFTAWITAALVFFEEQLVLKKTTEYSVNIMYYTGMALLIITVLSVALAIVLAWGKDENKQIYISVYYNLVWKGFIFSIILWLTALAIH